MLRRNAIRAYNEAEQEFLVSGADAHGLVEILFSELISSITAAREGLSSSDLAAKSAGVSKALSIIHVLASSLDFEKGGDVADSLLRLYEWSRRTIIEGSRDGKASAFDEVLQAVSEIAEAWRSIGGQHAAARAAQVAQPAV
ncbi:MAG: flagellar export chaperone FliS [Beijerinckiaceae bacterium]